MRNLRACPSAFTSRRLSAGAKQRDASLHRLSVGYETASIVQNRGSKVKDFRFFLILPDFLRIRRQFLKKSAKKSKKGLAKHHVFCYNSFCCSADVAQPVERILGKDEVHEFDSRHQLQKKTPLCEKRRGVFHYANAYHAPFQGKNHEIHSRHQLRRQSPLCEKRRGVFHCVIAYRAPFQGKNHGFDARCRLILCPVPI